MSACRKEAGAAFDLSLTHKHIPWPLQILKASVVAPTPADVGDQTTKTARGATGPTKASADNQKLWVRKSYKAVTAKTALPPPPQRKEEAPDITPSALPSPSSTSPSSKRRRMFEQSTDVFSSETLM